MAERFSSLKYNPKKATRPLDQEFPELFRHTEFRQLKEWGNWEKILSYILFMYQKDTDLVEEYPSNLKERKEAAAIEAGYERRDDGSWPTEIQKIMDIKNEIVYNAILKLLQIQKHAIWTEIVVCEQELYDFQRLRFRPIETGDKKKTRKRKPGEDSVEEEDTTSKNSKGKELDIYSAANKKDALMDACNKRIAALENWYSQLFGDSKAELSNPEFEEAINPENAERILNPTLELNV